MKRQALVSAVLLSFIAYVPAARAQTDGGTCVPAVCGAGTHASGDMCVADVVCGAGTYASGGTCLPTPEGTDPAVAYQINAAHTGDQPVDSLRLPLAKRWSRDLGGPVSYPLIVGSRVFVTVGNTSTYGSKLYALDLSTGSTLWSVALSGTYFFSAAAYDANRVFVINYDGLLKAFDAATGAQLWISQMPGQYSFTSPPSALNGTVYVGGAGSGGTLYAVSESSGTVLWTAPVANGDHSSPAVASSGAYVSYACAQSYGFSPSGTALWHYSTYCSGGGGKTPVLYKNNVYVRDNITGNVTLNATTGASLGGFTADRAPAFDGNTGFFLSGTTLKAIDITTNTVKWTFTGDNALNSAPIVVNGKVYVGSGGGNLYALDATTGTLVSSAVVGSAIAAPDEQNASQLTGLAAGNGFLLVPATNQLAAY